MNNQYTDAFKNDLSLLRNLYDLHDYRETYHQCTISLERVGEKNVYQYALLSILKAHITHLIPDLDLSKPIGHCVSSRMYDHYQTKLNKLKQCKTSDEMVSLCSIIPYDMYRMDIIDSHQKSVDLIAKCVFVEMSDDDISVLCDLLTEYDHNEHIYVSL